MTIKQTTLGGTAADVHVGRVAEGLMLMTWKANPVPDEQCFETIKTSIDNGCTFINSGEFYGINPPEANLELVARFIAKYPAYKDKFFLSVKGGLMNMAPDASEENLRRSITNINAKLGGKKLDLFEMARVDPKVPIETAIERLEKLRLEGLFGHIGISEASADTLRRASKVAKIAAIEIEISPWSWEEETKKVIAAAKELDVAVIGYSPLGRGFLTGTITSKDQLDDGDFRKHHERFQDENLKQNLKLADALKAFAEKKGLTPAQLCIAWVASLGPKVIPLPGSSHPKRLLENIAAADVVLTEEESAEIEKIIEANPVSGGRYSGHAAKLMWG
ncbi:aldo/keto reductase [Calocera viscosa TUFC12733]|uniref:Aldo/keto reductase n=1 Tax=Calocera viscosa (strain TUFC12733) TaxID=1330018 RepID=A0A167LH92_CALVF|nr:aldo/keto reductase [Calocera viscosa TUFC12733]